MDNFRSLGRKVSILHRYSRIYLAQALKEFNLHGSGQAQIVLNLADAGEGISQEELACRLLVDKTTISRMVKPMIENGVVERRGNPKDKRAYILSLSEHTRSRLPEISNVTFLWTKVLETGMDEQEVDHLHRLLDAMTDNARIFLQGEND